MVVPGTARTMYSTVLDLVPRGTPYTHSKAHAFTRKRMRIGTTTDAEIREFEGRDGIERRSNARLAAPEVFERLSDTSSCRHAVHAHGGEVLARA